MFYLRSFLAHIWVRRSRGETSQACMSTKVSFMNMYRNPYHGINYITRFWRNHVILNLCVKYKFETSEQQQGENMNKDCWMQQPQLAVTVMTHKLYVSSSRVSGFFINALPVSCPYISTQMYGMSQQSLHEWVSTDQTKKGGGEMGGKIAHFASPGMQFPSTIHTSQRAI